MDFHAIGVATMACSFDHMMATFVPATLFLVQLLSRLSGFSCDGCRHNVMLFGARDAYDPVVTPKFGRKIASCRKVIAVAITCIFLPPRAMGVATMS